MFKNQKFIHRLIYALLLLYQTVFICVYNNRNNQISNVATTVSEKPVMNFGFVKLELFDLLVLVSLIFVIIYFKELKKQPRGNKSIIYVIMIYIFYQIIFIFPLSNIYNIDTINNLSKIIIYRFYFILVPIFVAFFFPTLKNDSTVIKWVCFSTIFLIIAGIINYRIQNIWVTNTGESRLLWGGAAIIFGFVFFVNYFVEKRKLINYLYILVAIIGFIFTNHRSAYVYFFIVFAIGVWFEYKGIQKLKPLLFALLFSGSFVVILAQNEFLWNSFTKRLSQTNTSDDNAQDRFTRWGLAFDYFLEHPVNGSLLSLQYYTQGTLQKSEFENYPPHNFIFEILSTQGIIGFAMIMFIIIKTLAIGFKNRSDKISYQMFLVLLFYCLDASFNAVFYSKWTTLILVLAISLILYRNKILHSHENSLVH